MTSRCRAQPQLRARRSRWGGALLVFSAVVLPRAAVAPLRVAETATQEAIHRLPSQFVVTSTSLHDPASPAARRSRHGVANWRQPCSNARRAATTPAAEDVALADTPAPDAQEKKGAQRPEEIVNITAIEEAKKEEERQMREKDKQERLQRELETLGGFNWIISALAAVGLLDTGYLTAVKLGGVDLACPSDAQVSCAQVLASPYASIGPVPLAAVGFVAYAGVFALSFNKEWPRNDYLWWLCFVMAVASSALMLVLLVVIHAPCFYCITSAITTALLLAVVETGRGRADERGNGMPRSTMIVLALAIIGAAAKASTLPAKSDDFFALTELYKPEHPPVRSESGAAEIALAKHLTSIGARAYTAWWCPHCQDQREQFGKQAVALAPFVQCSQADRRQRDECKERDIESYPTWFINGEVYKGEQKLSRLAKVSNFTEYLADTFKERPDSATEYIWN